MVNEASRQTVKLDVITLAAGSSAGLQKKENDDIVEELSPSQMDKGATNTSHFLKVLFP